MPDKHRRLQIQNQSDPQGLDHADPLIAHVHLRLHRQEKEPINHSFSSHCLERPDPPESPNEAGIRLDATLCPPGSSQWHEQDDNDYGFPRINDLKMIGSNASHMSYEDGMYTVGATVTATEKNGNVRENGGVTEAVRGIYRMWKAQTPSATTGAFVEMVKLALEGL